VGKLHLDEVWGNPVGATAILKELDCVEWVSLLRLSEGQLTFQITLVPCDVVFIAEGYPVERINLLLYRNGDIHAIPKWRKGRKWNHRYRHFGIATGLCLWYPHDPPELRWTWDDGLEEYVLIVSRHLIYEEYWRRTGEWPVEDAPHDDSYSTSRKRTIAGMNRG